MLFDTHTHLNAYQFADDLPEVIDRPLKEGVSRMVVVGFDRPTIEIAMDLIENMIFSTLPSAGIRLTPST